MYDIRYLKSLKGITDQSIVNMELIELQLLVRLYNAGMYNSINEKEQYASMRVVAAANTQAMTLELAEQIRGVIGKTWEQVSSERSALLDRVARAILAEFSMKTIMVPKVSPAILPELKPSLDSSAEVKSSTSTHASVVSSLVQANNEAANPAAQAEDNIENEVVGPALAEEIGIAPHPSVIPDEDENEIAMPALEKEAFEVVHVIGPLEDVEDLEIVVGPLEQKVENQKKSAEQIIPKNNSQGGVNANNITAAHNLLSGIITPAGSTKMETAVNTQKDLPTFSKSKCSIS